jgi:hypothetical protein
MVNIRYKYKPLFVRFVKHIYPKNPLFYTIFKIETYLIHSKEYKKVYCIGGNI